MRVINLCKSSDWEKNHSGFMVAGSKLVWESAVYAHRCDKVVISRVVHEGGKPFLMGLGYIKRYVSPELLVTKLIPRSTNKS
jgi:hypothetical protein